MHMAREHPDGTGASQGAPRPPPPRPGEAEGPLDLVNFSDLVIFSDLRFLSGRVILARLARPTKSLNQILHQINPIITYDPLPRRARGPKLMGGEEKSLSGKASGRRVRSDDRNNKATLRRTRPVPASQSSARASSRRAVKLRCARPRPTSTTAAGGSGVQGRGLFVLTYGVPGRTVPFRHGFRLRGVQP